MHFDLTKGPVIKSMLYFAIPMILGNLLQQCYNIIDTLIVGQFIGRNALAAVGSSFTLMTFLTSIILGLCMGSGALFSIRFGQSNEKLLIENLCVSFFFITFVTLILNILVFIFLDVLRTFLKVPSEVWAAITHPFDISSIHSFLKFRILLSTFPYFFRPHSLSREFRPCVFFIVIDSTP